MEGPKPKGRGWFRISTETREVIAAEYKAGASINELAQKHGLMWLTVKNIIKKTGIPIRSNKAGEIMRKGQKLLPKDQEEILIGYESGLGQDDLAEAYGVSQTAISKVVRRRGISRPASLNKKRYFVDETVFDAITEESAYWIGFLMADGGIVESDGHSPSIHVGLQEGDAAHLEKFRSFLKAGHKISVIRSSKNGNSAHFSVRSQRLAEALAKYGVLPKKSHTAKVIGLENDRHFWRGVIDGDGCIHIKKEGGRPVLNLVGSQALLEQFLNYASACVRTNATVRPHATIFQVALTGDAATGMIQYLYQDCTVALDRKLEAAKVVMAEKAAVEVA